MIDELEFNAAVAKYAKQEDQGCLFLDEQFRRAIEEGAVALVQNDLKSKVIEAYVAIGRANQHILAVMPHEKHGNPWAEAVNRASASISDAAPKIMAARDALLSFLGTEKGPT
jgi:restriction endonuclease